MTRYERLAKAAGVRLCTVFECSWKGGMEPGVVHFGYVRYTSRGALWFLKEAHWATMIKKPEGLPRYERAMWINATAKRAGIRIPRSVWEEERARMREDLSRYARHIPPKSRSPEYEKAVRWAERKEDR